MAVTAWINVYRSGYFHTCGKPGCPDIHGGDIYLDKDDAVKAIDPPSHYLGTVPVPLDEALLDQIFA